MTRTTLLIMCHSKHQHSHKNTSNNQKTIYHLIKRQNFCQSQKAQPFTPSPIKGSCEVLVLATTLVSSLRSFEWVLIELPIISDITKVFYNYNKGRTRLSSAAAYHYNPWGYPANKGKRQPRHHVYATITTVDSA